MDKEDINIFMQRLEKTFSLLGAKKEANSSGIKSTPPCKAYLLQNATFQGT